VAVDALRILEQPLTAWERAWSHAALRKLVLLIVLATAWEWYARWLDNALLVPTFSATVSALWEAVSAGRSWRAPPRRSRCS
jgi:NitT/TauT family transport system permease protein